MTPAPLFIGVLELYKNIDGLARAWRLAAVRLPGVRLRLVGRGSRRDVVARLVRDLPAQATWTERLTQLEIAEAIDQATCLVLPSRSEGHSIAFLEALASGIPVVASTIAPFQFAKTLPCVQLVDTDDTAAYAAALLGALAQPKVQRSLAGLTLQDTAQRYLALAQQVIGARA